MSINCNRNICELGGQLLMLAMMLFYCLFFIFAIMPLTILSAIFVWPFLKINEVEYGYHWDEWFAWRPVYLDNDSKYGLGLAWFTTVQRRRQSGGGSEFRALPPHRVK